MLKQRFERYDNYKGEVDSRDFTKLFNHFVGKMLTFIDASVADKTQREAQKQIIKQMIWDDYEAIQQCLYARQNCKDEDVKDLPSDTRIFPF